MKKKIILMLLCAVVVAAAQNPDGKNVSLHLTPLWMWGSSKYKRITSVWYPQSYISDAQTVTSSNYGIADNTVGFGIATEVKIPTTSFLTLTLSYSYNPRFEEENKNPSYNVSPYYSQYTSINGNLQTVSATISLYNLFSLYMGD